VSLGGDNTEEQIDGLLSALQTTVAKLQHLTAMVV